VFRRSNYYQLLSKGHYPMRKEDLKCLYTPDVSVFRGAESDGYPFLSQVHTVAFIAMAAFPRPTLVSEQRGKTTELRFSKDYEERMRMKIRCLLRVALQHGHRQLCLSAWGCGAFGNPPFHVAELFKQELQPLRCHFERVVFAILDDKNTGKGHNRQGNVAPFMEVFADWAPQQSGTTSTSSSSSSSSNDKKS